jgi:hypothetical protein
MKTNQEKFRALCEQASITQKRAAEWITEQNMRPFEDRVGEVVTEFSTLPCVARTVRQWLADPELPSARNCPDWAVAALEARLRFLKLIP